MASSAARRTASGSAPAAWATAFAFSATGAISASVGSRPALTGSSSATGQCGRAQLGPGSNSCILSLQQSGQRRSKLRWAWGDGNSSRLHRRDLRFRVALAARDDGAGMAHAAARRRGAAGDEADGRLFAPALGLIGEELRGILLGAAADLANHDDALGLVVGQEHLEHVDEFGALDRVAADADRG